MKRFSFDNRFFVADIEPPEGFSPTSLLDFPRDGWTFCTETTWTNYVIPFQTREQAFKTMAEHNREAIAGSEGVKYWMIVIEMLPPKRWWTSGSDTAFLVKRESPIDGFLDMISLPFRFVQPNAVERQRYGRERMVEV